jgi:hypothetical protein
LYDVDNLSIEDLHWKLKFADSGRLPGGQTRFVDVLRTLVRGMTYLPPGVTTTLQALLHHRTRFPRHQHLPPTKGEKCYPCVRYEVSPMSRAAHPRQFSAEFLVSVA